MASRFLPRSPIRHPSRLLALRHRSDGPQELHVAEPADADVAESIRGLEDAMHDIDVRRAAPPWLPFLPGSSYWVPPRRRRVDAERVARLVGRIGDPTAGRGAASVGRGGGGGTYLVQGEVGIGLAVPPHPFEESILDRGGIKSDDDEA